MAIDVLGQMNCSGTLFLPNRTNNVRSSPRVMKGSEVVDFHSGEWLTCPLKLSWAMKSLDSSILGKVIPLTQKLSYRLTNVLAITCILLVHQALDRATGHCHKMLDHIRGA